MADNYDEHQGKDPMPVIYHITTATAWNTAQAVGIYRSPSLDMEGFIHASFEHQIDEVRQNFYRSASDLVLLSIDPQRLTAEVRYEPGTGRDIRDPQLFPHVYGPLNLEAIIDAAPLPSIEA
ncbi:DUF952 domain-containing protein [Ktedonospora formicarum]|uniref:DUF952 domain-containing protein n=1 Tax=Ktedonospora formicarum TaxID=2778364 RepID=A0A8J3MSY4_9CHLR|nr:DUF952 domain-containing protein [Ktedonospora formicarum]GHO46600.1 hypothetical protein KSX_47630 [Ktedonospora formicarum]